MKVEHGQTHLDLAVIGYGNQAAYFKLGDDNVNYQPTVDEPYQEMTFPVQFEVGAELMIDNSSDLYIREQMKVLDKTAFKVASFADFEEDSDNCIYLVDNEGNFIVDNENNKIVIECNF
ncbi:MAG TPA: hypothetical protein PLP27_08295 [Crocinitomicaceae bacterium]|nr:hypothetical protein [Crocinitomicaceae bacterium]